MYKEIGSFLAEELEQIKKDGLFKSERVISGPQGADVALTNGAQVINLCSNNYLGLSAHPEVIKAAKDTLDTHGFGMSSVRFICGTQDIHKTLEQKIASFYQTEDTILYAAAFDANGGLFEPLFGPEDAIISDALNHASIIDGVRLCKAKRYRYSNSDMTDLEAQLKQAQEDGARFKIIVTDGVFSMDGLVAPLDQICDLADHYNALVMVDECHAAGFLGATGRGSLEAKGVMGRVDIITGTLGKALGGAMGGYTTGKKEIIEMLPPKIKTLFIFKLFGPSYCGGIN
jgi:glycine C-acetyltransferase